MFIGCGLLDLFMPKKLIQLLQASGFSPPAAMPSGEKNGGWGDDPASLWGNLGLVSTGGTLRFNTKPWFISRSKTPAKTKCTQNKNREP